MKKIFSILGITLFITSGLAQSGSAQSMNYHTTQINDLMLRQLDENVRKGKDAYDHIDGSPYLNEEFVLGTVNTSRGNFENVNMRYNIYEDAVQFNTGSQFLYLDANPIIEEISLSNQKYVVKAYPFKSGMVAGFLIELESGKVSLYIKKNITFKEGEKAKALESEPTPPKFIQTADWYYLQINEEELIRVNNAKHIIEALSEVSPNLKKYHKSEKLSNRKVEDLTQLIKFVNTQL